jgi:hypothetical protein
MHFYEAYRSRSSVTVLDRVEADSDRTYLLFFTPTNDAAFHQTVALEILTAISVSSSLVRDTVSSVLAMVSCCLHDRRLHYRLLPAANAQSASLATVDNERLTTSKQPVYTMPMTCRKSSLISLT